MHFLAVGVLLFLLFEWLEPSTGEDVIVVNDAALARMVGLRNPGLSREATLAELDQLDADALARLREQYVREEVLYREALALGLDEADDAAKRRLIAQLDYLNRGIFRDRLELSETEIEAFYGTHRERYRIPAQRTFTHVFIAAADADVHAGADPLRRAEIELRHLNDQSLPFHESSSRGDHFLFHRNYVGRTEDEISAHFGTAFAEALFALDAHRQWQGPLRSNHGLHLVLVAEARAAFIPPLADVNARVRDDLARERVRAQSQAFFETARDRYQIVIDDSRRP